MLYSCFEATFPFFYSRLLSGIIIPKQNRDNGQTNISMKRTATKYHYGINIRAIGSSDEATTVTKKLRKETKGILFFKSHLCHYRLQAHISIASIARKCTGCAHACTAQCLARIDTGSFGGLIVCCMPGNMQLYSHRRDLLQIDGTHCWSHSTITNNTIFFFLLSRHSRVCRSWLSFKYYKFTHK